MKILLQLIRRKHKSLKVAFLVLFLVIFLNTVFYSPNLQSTASKSTENKEELPDSFNNTKIKTISQDAHPQFGESIQNISLSSYRNAARISPLLYELYGSYTQLS